MSEEYNADSYQPPIDQDPSMLDQAVQRVNDFVENIAEHGPHWKRNAAALMAAQAIHFGMFAGAGVAAVEHIGRDDVDEKIEHVEHSASTATQPGIFEQLKIPAESELPPLLDAPLGNPKFPNPDLEALRPTFVASYRSIDGLGFNVYKATQPGQEAALDQDFKVNPQSIEYMISQIEAHIADAPENPAKAAIIKNLQDMKDGTDDRILDLVFDVSPEAGCLDADRQLIAITKGVCKAGGLTFVQYGSDGEVRWPIAVSTGIEQKTVAASTEGTAAFNKKFEELGATVETESSEPVQHYTKTVSPATQQVIVQHELIHALSDAGNSNITNKEGDYDHEISTWLLADHHVEAYDYKGAKAASPELSGKIFKLVKSGQLKPILEVIK